MTDPVLARVRKLLAKAEDRAATPQESELYTAKAAELIAEHGIDAALLAAEAPESDPVGDLQLGLGSPYSKDKAELLCTVALHLRCRAVTRVERRADGPTQHSVHLFGHASDLASTELLFTSLLLQATRQLMNTPVPAYEHKAAFRRSWFAGFRLSIGRRLAEADRQSQAASMGRTTSDGRGVQLVLADRSDHVDAALRAAYPITRVANRRHLSGSGGPLGFAAGTAADLGGSRLTGPHRSLGR